jgi:hypothetical protein
MPFYDRSEKQSSTSKYIQANKTNADGSFSADPSALKGTPSDKIITPQLKDDTNSTVSLDVNPLAKLLGFISSLIPATNTKKIEEPKPTDNKAEYGKIQVKENKAGFIVINDETPGNVRQINLHPTGTYNALLNNGDYHTKTANDKQEITVGNWNITTEKDKIEIISGNNKIEIRKDIYTNIAGKSDYNLTGTQSNVIAGDVTDDFKANYTGKVAENYSENVGGDKKETTSGDLTEEITGDHKENVSGSLSIQVSGNITIVSSGNTKIMSTGACNIISSSLVKISAPKIKLG